MKNAAWLGIRTDGDGGWRGWMGASASNALNQVREETRFSACHRPWRGQDKDPSKNYTYDYTQKPLNFVQLMAIVV